MTKICHITSAHPPEDVRIYHKECRSLSAAGYHVLLMVSGHKGIQLEGVDMVNLPGFQNRILRIFGSPFLFFIYALRQRAALYHLHDPELLATGFLLKLSGQKVIYDAHEDTSRQIMAKYYMARWVRKGVSWMVRQLENMAARFFDAIVTVSEGVEQAFPDKLQKRVIQVRNYPRLREFEDIKGEAFAEVREAAVCYVGALSRQRGFETLLSSLDHHGALLELAGYFYPPQLAGQIERSPHRPRIRYHGVVNRKGLSRIFSRSKIGLVTLLPGQNHQVALPVKLFEYMAAGLPVIASNFPLWRSIIENNQCGLCIEPGDPEALGATIDYLMNRPDLRSRMGANGRRAVQSTYNWTGQEKKLLGLYEKLLAS